MLIGFQFEPKQQGRLDLPNKFSDPLSGFMSWGTLYANAPKRGSSDWPGEGRVSSMLSGFTINGLSANEPFCLLYEVASPTKFRYLDKSALCLLLFLYR